MRLKYDEDVEAFLRRTTSGATSSSEDKSRHRHYDDRDRDRSHRSSKSKDRDRERDRDRDRDRRHRSGSRDRGDRSNRRRSKDRRWTKMATSDAGDESRKPNQMYTNSETPRPSPKDFFTFIYNLSCIVEKSKEIKQDQTRKRASIDFMINFKQTDTQRLAHKTQVFYFMSSVSGYLKIQRMVSSFTCTCTIS